MNKPKAAAPGTTAVAQRYFVLVFDPRAEAIVDLTTFPVLREATIAMREVEERLRSRTLRGDVQVTMSRHDPSRPSNGRIRTTSGPRSPRAKRLLLAHSDVPVVFV